MSTDPSHAEVNRAMSRRRIVLILFVPLLLLAGIAVAMRFQVLASESASIDGTRYRCELVRRHGAVYAKVSSEDGARTSVHFADGDDPDVAGGEAEITVDGDRGLVRFCLGDRRMTYDVRARSFRDAGKQ